MYALFVCLDNDNHLFLVFFSVVVTVWVSGIGITAGAHRLWSHKSYTASLPLRILLAFAFSIAGQVSTS